MLELEKTHLKQPADPVTDFGIGQKNRSKADAVGPEVVPPVKSRVSRLYFFGDAALFEKTVHTAFARDPQLPLGDAGKLHVKMGRGIFAAGDPPKPICGAVDLGGFLFIPDRRAAKRALGRAAAPAARYPEHQPNKKQNKNPDTKISERRQAHKLSARMDWFTRRYRPPAEDVSLIELDYHFLN